MIIDESSARALALEAVAYERRILERYLEGQDSTAIGRGEGVSRYAVLAVLRAVGIERRDHSSRRRRYQTWDAAFSSVSDEAGYWIGFLMADGCIQGSSLVTVTLAQRDQLHLTKLLRFLRAETRPLTPGGDAGVTVRIHSSQLVSDLARHGVRPAKTFNAEASPEIVGFDPFWLGVFDGDGCISARSSGWRVTEGRLRLLPSAVTVGLTSASQRLSEQFAEYVARTLDERPPPVRQRKGVFDTRIGGRRALALLAHWYASCPEYALSRKVARALQVIARAQTFEQKP